jgi:hypothetical protein
MDPAVGRLTEICSGRALAGPPLVSKALPFAVLAIALLAELACQPSTSPPAKPAPRGGTTGSVNGAGGTSGSGGSSGSGGQSPSQGTGGLSGGATPGGRPDADVIDVIGPTPSDPDARAGTGSDAIPTLPADENAHLMRPLPVLLITVDGGRTILRDVKVPARLKVIEAHDGNVATFDAVANRPATLDVSIGIEYRGASSFAYAQKPYGFEIRDQTGEGVATPLLGLPPEADFILHSCYADKTCLRNALSYAVGREMAVPQGHWAPRTRYVEVFVDGRYQGLYLLVERLKRDKNRVNIPGPAADAASGDITGGYMISQEGDNPRAGIDYVNPLYPGGRIVQRYPKIDLLTPSQRMYLDGALKNLGQVFTATPRFTETTRKVLDETSFIDFALIQELSNNVDAFWKSWFMVKEPDRAGGRFITGPLWDFDIAYGNIIFKKSYCTNTWASANLRGPLVMVFQDAAFNDNMRCRWHQLRATGGPLDLARIDEKIAAFVKHMTAAKERDQARWKNIGAWIWPNNYIGGTWADEVSYLRYWLRRRIAFMDASLPGKCAMTPAPSPVMPIAAPPHMMENNVRMPYPGRDAPVYVPIDTQLTGTNAVWSCPR